MSHRYSDNYGPTKTQTRLYALALVLFLSWGLHGYRIVDWWVVGGGAEYNVQLNAIGGD